MLTQYLESKEDQGMTRLPNFIRILGGMRRRTRRGRVRLTQYLESQEDQDMTRLLYFTRTQEMRRDRVFFCALEWKKGGFI